MTTSWWLVCALPAILAFSAIASASETTLFSLTRVDRERLRAIRPGAARAVDTLLAKPRRLLVLVLLVNMLANVSYFVLSALASTLAESAATGAGIGVVSLVAVVLFGEVLPKLLGQRYRVRAAAFIAPPGAVAMRVLAPAVGLIEHGVVVPAQRLVAPAGSHGPRLSAEDVQRVVAAAAAAGDLAPGEDALLADVLELGRVRAAEVMTPRVDTPTVLVGSGREDVVRAVRATRRTHLPVCEDGPTRVVVGVLDVQRFLAAPAGAASVRDASAAPLFVPDTARLDRVLILMREAGVSLAVCVDEHGSFTGVIETEDIVAELLGELGEDDPDEVEAVRAIGPGAWRVPASLAVRDAEAIIGKVAPRGPGGVRTVGGLVVAALGRLPREGEAVELPGVRLVAERVSRRRVERVVIELRELSP